MVENLSEQDENELVAEVAASRTLLVHMSHNLEPDLLDKELILSIRQNGLFSKERLNTIFELSKKELTKLRKRFNR